MIENPFDVGGVFEKKESFENVALESPSAQYKDSYLEALEEFQREGKYTYLDRDKLGADFGGFVEEIPAIRMEINNVPETEYWLINGDEYIGRVSIRHELNKELLMHGGHIGYAIRPSQRKKGYGVKILELGLEKARELSLTRVLLTCDSTNVGSRKIIESHGGILENEVEGKTGESTKLRFWIDINK
jgi:predicted acetyltransferase